MKKFLCCLLIVFAISGSAQQTTYCNPMNLDYGYTPIPNFSESGRHRATADPVIVLFKGDYYLFSTNQWGYWHSPDLLHWTFVFRHFLKPYHHVYDDLCAPAAWVMGDTLFVFGSTYSRNFPIWMSTNPKANEWKEAIDSLEIGGWDPGFFLDDDNRLYMYNGSSNRYPLYGIELNRKTFQPIGTRQEMFLLDDQRFGWQRFGEYLDNTFLHPFIEGAWMNKHNGKYYLQYGAPGTEFSGYADGVQVSDHPLGPWTPQPMPFSYKPGGFARGAGHGATFQDKSGAYWHVSTIVVSTKNNFERRLGLWPAGFDKDGVMYCNQAFGDYPMYLPQAQAQAPIYLPPTGEGNGGDRSGEKQEENKRTTKNHGSKVSPVGGDLEGAAAVGFTGWMLLNYNKPVQVSSTLGAYLPNNAVDENIKTYWSATSANRGEYIQTDLGTVSTVRAIQINYADQDVDSAFLGKIQGIYHQYKLYSSTDGKSWKTLLDKSTNKTDVPHDYIELPTPVEARYIKLENIHMPTGKFAISGLRVFGLGHGAKPDAVRKFVVLRTEEDKRSAWLKWEWNDRAYAYNIFVGVAPDKLYNCIMVHNANEYYYKGMDRTLPYYFQIEAINENGVSQRTPVMKVE